MLKTEVTKSIFDVLIAYQGVIGAIVGSVVTLIVTHYIKNLGRIKASATNVEIKQSHQDFVVGIWKELEVKPGESPNHLECYLEMTFYNQSDVTKGLTDLQLLFVCNDKSEVALNIDYCPDALKPNIRTRLQTINVPPKEFITFLIRSKYWLKEKEIVELPKNDVKRLYLIGYNSKNKRKKFKLWESKE